MLSTGKKKVRHARFQERTADEEEEAQRKAKYDENLKAKSGLIMAEFEKHKKKMFLTASETLQENETKVLTTLQSPITLLALRSSQPFNFRK